MAKIDLVVLAIIATLRLSVCPAYGGSGYFIDRWSHENFGIHRKGTKTQGLAKGGMFPWHSICELDLRKSAGNLFSL